MSPVLALSGHAGVCLQCLLSSGKRTSLSCINTNGFMSTRPSLDSLHPDSLLPVAVCERMLLGNSRVTLVGLIIAIFGVAFMFGGHPVIAALLLLLTSVLVMLDEDMRSG